MSLAFLAGAAAAFKGEVPEEPSKPRRVLLKRQPTTEEVVHELFTSTLEIPIEPDGESERTYSRTRTVRRSTSHVFSQIVARLSPEVHADPIVEESPWKRIDAIGGGLFICGAAALQETAHLERLGIRSIVNCAERSLYDRTDFCVDGQNLAEKLRDFRVECLDAEDVESCLMPPLWDQAAQFIDESLKSGGVVVHCAMGVSRSSSTCIAYLMLRQGLTLEAAFCQVFQARDHIMPNVGFWQQLHNLEKRIHGSSRPLCQQIASGRQENAARAFFQLDCQLREKHEAEMAGW